MTPSLLHDNFHYGDAEHAQYLREGYCILDPFLSAEGLAWCRRNIDDMIERLRPGHNPEDLIAAHQIDPWLWELATQPRLLDLIKKQIGPNIVLWASQCLCKPPHTGRLVPWHQDAPYWNMSGQHAGGIWIALDDIDDDNGAMAVLPHWHTKGTLPVRPRGETYFKDEIVPGALPPDIDDLKIVYRVPAGALATHHTMIPHNSPPNRSDRWRRVVVLRYIDATAEMGPKTFTDYRTGESFPRRFFLVRGKDVEGKGLEVSPFLAPAER